MFTRQQVAIIQHLIAQAIQQNQAPIARDGVVTGGTWDPKDGTATAMFGDTYAIVGDDGDQYIPQPKIPVASTQLGDQYGPVGNERAVLLHTQGGPVMLFLHDEDDSLGVPAGERWIAHRNAQGQIDSYIKHTNDGPTAGDGLGGHISNGGALHKSGTSGGHSVTQDDTAKKITVQSAGGQSHVFDDNAKTITQTSGPVKHIVDGQNNVLSSVATSVGVGDLYSSLATANAAFRKNDADQLATNIKKTMGNLAQQMAQAAISSGVTNATAWLAAIQAGLPTLSFTDLTGSVASLSVPSGSSNVRIK